jgi:hypothetical protein
MKFVSQIAAAALAAALATPAFATDFVGSYTVTLNTTDPGLVLDTQSINTDLGFTLTSVGDSQSVDLFDLFTNETTVNSDDTALKPISVSFDFTTPATSGSVTGQTNGQKILFGLFQDGVVNWDGPQVLDFGNGGELQVSLNNATFNTGLFGLNHGEKAGADIVADFTLLQSPSAVPEPAVWGMMLVGFGGMGAAMRQRRKAIAAA